MSTQTARDYFNRVRRDSVALQGYLREIDALKDGIVPSSAETMRGAKGAGDPVFGTIVRASEMLASVEAKRDAALESIGEALAIIEGARRAMGSKADAVELYYIDVLEWDDVARELGVSERTARYWANDVFAMLDATPPAYIVGLRGANC